MYKLSHYLVSVIRNNFPDDEDHFTNPLEVTIPKLNIWLSFPVSLVLKNETINIHGREVIPQRNAQKDWQKN